MFWFSWTMKLLSVRTISCSFFLICSLSYPKKIVFYLIANKNHSLSESALFNYKTVHTAKFFAIVNQPPSKLREKATQKLLEREERLLFVLFRVSKPKRQPEKESNINSNSGWGKKGEKCSAVSINEPYKTGFLLPLFCSCVFTPFGSDTSRKQQKAYI